jgi:hypothetical protein
MTTTTLTILRPSGKTEIVDVSAKFCGMSPELFAKIKAATKAACKGDVLSYNVTTTEPVMSAADLEHKAYWDSRTKIERTA